MIPPEKEFDPKNDGSRDHQRLNLVALPADVSRCASVQRAFENLNTGESLLIMDDFSLEWIVNCLEACQCENSSWEPVSTTKNAGRNEIIVKKKPNPRDVEGAV